MFKGAGRKRRRTTWISALAVLGVWLPGVIPVIQVARTFAIYAVDDGGTSRRRQFASAAKSTPGFWLQSNARRPITLESRMDPDIPYRHIGA